MTCTDSQQLTINRLFEAPALSGPTVTSIKFAPDGSRVFFLKSDHNENNRLNLWEYDQQRGTSKVLIDSKELGVGDVVLSDEENARRERQRRAAHSGILDYEVSPCGTWVIFLLGGELFIGDVTESGDKPAAAPLPTKGRVTDPSISSTGRYVAYVLDQNLFSVDKANGQTRQLTYDGGGVIKNGMAEFVAQEEMDRNSGYWWSPDDKHIAFARIDESQVFEAQRFEISADNVKTFAQRYPAAGASNVTVEIGVLDVESLETVWIDLGPNRDIYVARVDWLPDGRTLAIQCQSRDQKRLDLLFADIASGRSRVLLSERSSSWIDLHQELTFLKSSNEFVWASNRTGYTHLYSYRTDGQLVRQITRGDWNVDDFRARAIKGIDERNRVIYFVSTAKTPLERHLYKISLDAGDFQQITEDQGVHAVTMTPSCAFFIDQFNSSNQAPRVGLYDSDGRLQHWLLENRMDENHPDAPYLKTNAISEFGSLNAEDGQNLYYRIFKPNNFDASRRYPVVVDVYGGPGVQRVLNTWAGQSFAQILVRAGYIVMMLDNRGSAFRGVAFQSPILGQLGKVEVADQLVGARWLAHQHYVDAERMAVLGWSYGGYLTLMLMCKAPEVFCAGISGAPVTDWQLYDTHYTERYLGMPQKNVVGYARSSVLSHTAGLSGALLLMHGMCDDNVLLLHSTKLIRKLQDAAQSFDMMLYPGAKHGLLRQKDGRHAYAAMLHFLGRNLAASLAAPADDHGDATIARP